MALTDPAFLATTFVVMDFETLTPAGRPAEPIEVAAIAGRFGGDGRWMEMTRYNALMRPPDDVPVTRFDIAQNGLTPELLGAQRPASQVMADLDGHLTDPPYRLVAHSAQTEAAAIRGQRRHCPALVATPLLCTVRLARVAFPELRSHALNELLRYLRIPRPADRHRALPDAELTIAVFQQILATGHAAARWTSLRDLDAAGGVQITPEPAVTMAAGRQPTLF